jgi:putative heme-binding domain-containing protein
MYRYLIEHPIWIPPETLATLDRRAGANMGRIYRVVPEDRPTRPALDLAALPTIELAAALDTPNGTQRDLVQQLLTWRNDRTAVPVLRELCRESPLAEVRVQALAAWAQFEPPAISVLLQLLSDDHPAVRIHALRLAETRLDESPVLAANVPRLADDSNPRVRMQLAYSLAECGGDEAARILARLLADATGDVYLRSAALSSLTPDNAAAVFEQLRDIRGDDSEELIEEVLALAAALGNGEAAARLLGELLDAIQTGPDEACFRRLARYVEGRVRRSGASEEVSELRDRLQPALAAARETTLDPDLAPALRAAAAGFLGVGPLVDEEGAPFLVDLVAPQSPSEVQRAAVAALGSFTDEAIADMLLARWASYSPDLRQAVVALFLTRAPWSLALLAAIDERRVSADEIDLARRQALLEHPDEAIRMAAQRCLQSHAAPDRAQVIDQYAAALDASGISDAGRRVFVQHCAACHRLEENGHAVGPDIAAYADKPASAWLIAVLDPNQAVDPRYQTFLVLLEDGRTLSGLIVDETSTSLTILAAQGERHTVLRGDVEELYGTGKSLMPEGLEQKLSPDDASDLWAYIASLRGADSTGGAEDAGVR